ncbi:hypothetical protein HY993_03270 [Candidatus Micrarchaeota archaeon]|nr:hypothetical protein [Candidatus Micrarchaeota archaeon]
MALSLDGNFVWSVVAFSIAVWAASRFVHINFSITSALSCGLVLTVFMGDFQYFLAQDLITSLALLLVAGVGAQYLFASTMVEGVTVAVMAWLFGVIFLNVV